MGFLDRMVADFVADSTGLPVRSLVRRVGVSKLLLMGGAIAAGGAAVSAISNRNPSEPHQPQASPPLPPIPSPSTTPPLPPIPQTSSQGPVPTDVESRQDSDLNPDTTFALLRAMIGAALADGNLDPRERSAILEHLGDAGLSDERREQIHRDLVLPPTPEEIAALCPADATIAVYRAAILVTLTDHQLSDLERKFLDRLAQALGLPGDLGATIRDEMVRTLTS